jgi:DNA-binding NarL/FixJ family response regulator
VPRVYGDRNGMANPAHRQHHLERTPRGERHGSAKLTEWHVKVIRQLCREGKPQRQVAREFGVCRTTVQNILIGKKWRHVA